MATQGLINDVNRGQSTASARRDVPNTVFGMNSPGPLDRSDGAPKGTYGEQGRAHPTFQEVD